jgi:Fur family zinc uptake transcriptional regulator
MEKVTKPKVTLTKNQTLVIEALSRVDRPLGAYALLDELRDNGFKAPLQVYRALDKLIELGLVHRLESLNAYLACQLQSCTSHKTLNTSFAICQRCGVTKELPSSPVVETVDSLARKFNFSATGSTIEIQGYCSSCDQT